MQSLFGKVQTNLLTRIYATVKLIDDFPDAFLSCSSFGMKAHSKFSSEITVVFSRLAVLKIQYVHETSNKLSTPG